MTISRNSIYVPIPAILIDLLLASLAATVFSCAPAVLTGKGRDLPPAYGLKLMQPFADTSVLTIPAEPSERSHGSKLTARLVGAVLLWSVGLFRGHPYIPATVGTLLFLGSGLILGRRLGGGRLGGIAMALTYAGLFATSIGCSRVWMPKPFDGIALGLIGMTTAAVGSAGSMAGLGFLALWTDERAIVALGLTGMLVLVFPGLDRIEKVRHVCGLAATMVAYGTTRVAATWWLGWRPPDTANLFDGFPSALAYAQWAAWGLAEGAWIVVGIAIYVLLRRRLHARVAGLVFAALLAIGSTLVVQDISRAGAFCFPIVPCAAAVLADQRLHRVLVGVLSLAAVVSLLAPNTEIIRGVGMTWAMPLPAEFLLSKEFLKE